MQNNNKLKLAEIQLGDILPITITVIVIAIGAAFGLDILSDVQADFTVDSLEYNATQDGMEGVAKFPERLPLIATVIVAALLIGILVSFLVVRIGK